MRGVIFLTFFSVLQFLNALDDFLDTEGVLGNLKHEEKSKIELEEELIVKKLENIRTDEARLKFEDLRRQTKFNLDHQNVSELSNSEVLEILNFVVFLKAYYVSYLKDELSSVENYEIEEYFKELYLVLDLKDVYVINQEQFLILKEFFSNIFKYIY